jgi:hypothetical protein
VQEYPGVGRSGVAVVAGTLQFLEVALVKVVAVRVMGARGR